MLCLKDQMSWVQRGETVNAKDNRALLAFSKILPL